MLNPMADEQTFIELLSGKVDAFSFQNDFDAVRHKSDVVDEPSDQFAADSLASQRRIDH